MKEKKGILTRKQDLKLQKKDYVLMCLFTLAFFLLALWRLGSHELPQTEQTLAVRADGGREAIFYFDSYQTISELEIFMGYHAQGNVSVSVADDNEWEIIQDNRNITSVFAWNTVPVSYQTSCLGLVFSDAADNIEEIVCLDGDKNIVTPVNAAEYPQFFDEQSLYGDGVTYQDQTIFDEVYHGRTAYEFLHRLPIYENTHPPLGKTLISIGIAVFGMNPFGWRFMCVLCGSLMLPFLYLFGLRLTSQRKYAVLADVLLGTDFMHYTLSRIATIDIIVALFILGMFYFMYAFLTTEDRRYLVWAGLFTGLGCSTKWTAIYALAALGIVFLLWMIGRMRKTGIKGEALSGWMGLGLQCVLCFLVLPFIIYTLSYIPFARVYTDQNILQHVFSNGKSMLEYHKNANEPHPYASPWYSWLVDYKPLLDSREYLPGDKVSVIATFGNPLLYYAGLFVYLAEAVHMIRKKDRQSLVLVIFYTVMLLPWVVITRTVFIYQYYVCSLVLILLLCHAVSRIRGKAGKGIYLILFAGSILLFAVFFPAISGLPVSYSYMSRVIPWLKNWRFV